MRIRVATWNIHSCVGTDRRYDPARVAEVLSELDADIIGLQEVDWRHPSVDGLDQLELFASRLGLRAIAGPNLRDHTGDYGNGLLTRLEIVHSDRVELVHTNREPRGAIDAMLEADHGRVRALVTHLGLARAERRSQIATLRDAVAHADSEPCVLLGDMNQWLPRALQVDTLSDDPFPAASWDRTFPSRWPLFRLDRVFAAPRPAHFHARAVRTRDARRASDHLPVVADIEWS